LQAAFSLAGTPPDAYFKAMSEKLDWSLSQSKVDIYDLPKLWLTG